MLILLIGFCTGIRYKEICTSLMILVIRRKILGMTLNVLEICQIRAGLLRWKYY